ncbi:MAG TPA: hypothetical protein VEA63_15650, partial [Opitutus sp.]|nr:hypothetical protein [Opitutus sp.]
NGSAIEGWFTMTGDGTAKIDFVPNDGFARMQIDGTQDRHNVWWTLIKRDITADLDLAKLADPAYELRVEARVRASHAPRRVNFMINTQRTTDFHQHLREYDLADTSDWHTISMTTQDFDARPGDTVFVQLAATDWGSGKYHLDVDYYRADVVRRDGAKPDVGEPLVYHPPIPDLKTFEHHLAVTHDSVVHVDFPDVNFNDWHVTDASGPARVLTVDARQSAILRWNFGEYRARAVDGAGILELTTSSVAKGGDYVRHFGQDLGIEFGKLRVIEILGGDPAWDQQTVTYRSLLREDAATDAFNGQMITDIELTEDPHGKSYATLPRPVMQRLLEGRTKGIILQPLGALAASVYASESAAEKRPTLHFNTRAK